MDGSALFECPRCGESVVEAVSDNGFDFRVPDRMIVRADARRVAKAAAEADKEVADARPKDRS